MKGCVQWSSVYDREDFTLSQDRMWSARSDYMIDNVDPDEVAHYEPPHQDLHCLQIQLFSSLVLKR